MRATQHYNIMEDLVQEPSAMLALEFLQTCPSQMKELLSAIGGIDPTISNLITFNLKNHVPCLLHQLDFFYASYYQREEYS